MFLQQADTNSKSLLCLHRKAHSATYEAVGDMPPPSGAQQSMIPIDFFLACPAQAVGSWVATVGVHQLPELSEPS